MALQINSNQTALNAQRNIGISNAKYNKAMERISSGLRINRAADDAAGLAIAERFSTQARQAGQESANLQQGISVVQTADGALSSQADTIGRIRELALQASNGTLTTDQRNALNTEAQQLVQQIDRTAQDTEFNGTQILNGTTPTVNLGTQGGEQVTLNNASAGALGVSGLDLSTPEGAQAALNSADTAAGRVSQYRASLGAQQNRFEAGVRSLQNTETSARQSESLIRDTDIARETISRTRNQMMLSAGISALSQANVSSQQVMGLLNAR
jgi:flagellin